MTRPTIPDPSKNVNVDHYVQRLCRELSASSSTITKASSSWTPMTPIPSSKIFTLPLEMRLEIYRYCSSFTLLILSHTHPRLQWEICTSKRVLRESFGYHDLSFSLRVKNRDDTSVALAFRLENILGLIDGEELALMLKSAYIRKFKSEYRDLFRMLDDARDTGALWLGGGRNIWKITCLHGCYAFEDGDPETWKGYYCMHCMARRLKQILRFHFRYASYEHKRR
ncbi:hypothetical protein BJ508DRAFT_329316 [Ascobolus immersus RN42]|uniref:F-box domain-containing protein n=1 Tax=Ascobolus immersus RN42 TaxID=1160509 RepID=A0A3N4I9A0_ASCIM|nr:hypothetical protein BJ508DRAFT_329316 [Ascobolus immersus RN42]